MEGQIALLSDTEGSSWQKKQNIQNLVIKSFFDLKSLIAKHAIPIPNEILQNFPPD